MKILQTHFLRAFLRGFFLIFFIKSFATINATSAKSTYQWPIFPKKKLQISSTFGESRIDHFHNGIDLPGKGLKIRPVHKGRIIWYYNQNEYAGELPFGGGKTVIMEHNDTWSGYMHLNELTFIRFAQSNKKSKDIKSQNPYYLQKDSVIGYSGNTGHSGGAHLHFFIYQYAKKIMYNPLLVLDNKYYQNNKPPEILQMAALIDGKNVIFNPQKEVLLSQDYPLLLKTLDRGTGSERWGVYSFSVMQNNKLITQRKFDRLVFSNDRWRDAQGDVFANVFFQDYLILGKGFRKSPDFSILLGGFRGPKGQKDYQLRIVSQ